MSGGNEAMPLMDNAINQVHQNFINVAEQFLCTRQPLMLVHQKSPFHDHRHTFKSYIQSNDPCHRADGSPPMEWQRARVMKGRGMGTKEAERMRKGCPHQADTGRCESPFAGQYPDCGTMRGQHGPGRINSRPLLAARGVRRVRQ